MLTTQPYRWGDAFIQFCSWINYLFKKFIREKYRVKLFSLLWGYLFIQMRALCNFNERMQQYILLFHNKIKIDSEHTTDHSVERQTPGFFSFLWRYYHRTNSLVTPVWSQAFLGSNPVFANIIFKWHWASYSTTPNLTFLNYKSQKIVRMIEFSKFTWDIYYLAIA